MGKREKRKKGEKERKVGKGERRKKEKKGWEKGDVTSRSECLEPLRFCVHRTLSSWSGPADAARSLLPKGVPTPASAPRRDLPSPQFLSAVIPRTPSHTEQSHEIQSKDLALAHLRCLARMPCRRGVSTSSNCTCS